MTAYARPPTPSGCGDDDTMHQPLSSSEHVADSPYFILIPSITLGAIWEIRVNTARTYK
jgi:hypothetical protein